MFISFNLVHIKCNECDKISIFQPGREYDFIGCLHCKENQAKTPIKKGRKKNVRKETTNTEKI